MSNYKTLEQWQDEISKDRFTMLLFKIIGQEETMVYFNCHKSL